MSKEKVVKEEVKGTCGEFKWWDMGTTREFHRDGIRKGLVEVRSICRSPSSKAKGHLTAKPSVRLCFERGTFVPEKKEKKAKVKEPKKKKTVVPKKEVATGKNTVELTSDSGEKKKLGTKPNGKIVVGK